jgi:hypothetical protein
MEYANLYNERTNSLGIRATKSTKPKAVLLMKKLVEDGSLILHDKTTLEQLGDFTETSSGGFSGKNLNDDLVSSLYWACYFIETNWLETGYKFEKKNEDDGPWGILSDIDIPQAWGQVINVMF